MPNKRHARKTHREAARSASAGDHRRALTGYRHAAAEYRAYLRFRFDDAPAHTELADLLGHIADAESALGRHARAATALAERLTCLRELDHSRSLLNDTELDLAEAHLRAGHLLSAATAADGATRSYDRRDAADPASPVFAEMAAALARNARVLRRAADPDLAVGAADQAARMLLALPASAEDEQRRSHLRAALELAVELHTAAGRDAHARTAARLFAEHFPGSAPAGARGAPPLTLRAALTAAARLGVFTDANLIDRLCPDPAAHDAPASIASRCDPGLAPVALHAIGGAVEALHGSHSAVAWRMATEIHYLLAAADRAGERNLRLNFRDHGPVWLGMLMALTGAAERRPDLAADLAGIVSGLLERLRSRHAAEGPLAEEAAAFVAAHRHRD
jgi:tetratricopeptide (TPR) repeat protein